MVLFHKTAGPILTSFGTNRSNIIRYNQNKPTEIQMDFRLKILICVYRK
jgi:hypothetical protein